MPNIDKYKKGSRYTSPDSAKYEYNAKKIEEGLGPITEDEKAEITNSFFKNLNDGASAAKNIASSAASSIGSNLSKSMDLPKYFSLQDNEQIQFSSLAGGVYNTLKTLIMADESTAGFMKKTDGLFNSLKSAFGFVGDAMTTLIAKNTELRNVLTKDLGEYGARMENFRNEIILTSEQVAYLGVGIDKLQKVMMDTTEQTGTLAMYNEKVFVEGAKAARLFLDDFSNFPGIVKNFEEVGFGAEFAAKKIIDVGKSSLEIGLNGKKVVNDLQTNISKLNSYGFQNGVDGLKKMVQQSTEFRYNMQKTFDIAERVMDPDSAIELSANLQALGGAAGDLMNPIKLMYDATNDVNGLQDALIGAASSLATYNNEQGRFEVTGANLLRARAIAKELGISMDDLAKTATKAQERVLAATDLTRNGLKLTPKETEFLTNISRMEGGKMVIDVGNLPKEGQRLFKGQTEVLLSNLDKQQKDYLVSQQKIMEETTPEDLMKSQLTELQDMEADLAGILAHTKVMALRAEGEGAGMAKELANKLGLKTGENYLQEKRSKFTMTALGSNRENNKLVQSELEAIPSSTPNTYYTIIPEADKKNKNNQTNQTYTTPQRIEVIHTVRATDSTGDFMKTQIEKDPKHQFNVFENYLNPNSFLTGTKYIPTQTPYRNNY